MEISKEEAQIILELAHIAWAEGLGSNGDHDLMKRIIDAYPALEVPALVEIRQKRYAKEGIGGQAPVSESLPGSAEE